MGARQLLHQARSLACVYASEPAAQSAAALSAAVAGLNGHIVDDGKAISHASNLLIAAQCAGIREWALQVLHAEITSALRFL